MRYVRWPSKRGSTHVYAGSPNGQTLTRCGRQFVGGEILESLPLNERSCERCLQLAAHDEQPDVANDEVAG